MRIFGLIVAALVSLALPVEANSPIAEVLCEDTQKLTDKLVHQFGEKRTATGLRGPEQIVEIWTDRQGDWTMVITYATGTSCIVAMGEEWANHSERDPA